MQPTRILALFVALILYGSFYPFRFDMHHFRDAWQTAGILGSMSFQYSGPGDTIANLLGYIPIGIFLRLSIRWAGWRGVLAAISGGALLSACIEVGQFATESRNPSLMDLLLNAIGTATGALMAEALWLRALPLLSEVRSSGTPVLAWLLALAWIGIHAAPFVPSLGMHKLRAALAPLKSMAWTVEGSARWFSAWLVFGAVVASIVPRRLFLRGAALAVAGSLCMRVAIVRQSLSWDEIIGLAIAAPLTVLAPASFTACCVLLGLVVAGFSPYHFQQEPSRLGWVPFVGFLEADASRVYLVVLEKSFLYAGAVWGLYRDLGLSQFTSGAIVAVVLGVVECAQRYLPDRSAEVSDPLIALLVIMLLEKKSPQTAPQ